MPFKRALNNYRGRKAATGPRALADRRASWEAFNVEAAMHIERLCDDHRDGGLRQISQRPELYQLPAGR